MKTNACKTILKSSTGEDYSASTSIRRGKKLVHIIPAEGTAGCWTYYLDTLLNLDNSKAVSNRLYVEWGKSWYVDNMVELLTEIVNCEKETTENTSIRYSIYDYYAALNNRQHGGIVANECLRKIQAILKMNYEDSYGREVNTYFVELDITIGEFAKTSHVLVKADNEDLACQYALYAESHCTDDLEWEDGCLSLYDDSGSMYYSFSSSKMLSEEETEILVKYFAVVTADQEELNTSGNYLEMIN